MQTHGGTAAAQAIESPEREFLVRLLVDWNQDGGFSHPLSDMSKYIDSASTDRSFRGSQSEALSIVEGASAAELTVKLSGTFEGRSLTSIFSPYQVHSPFWGRNTVGMEILYDIGVKTALGTTWYPQFVGHVRTVTPDRGGNSVEITALDRVELLRRPVQFPAWGIWGPQRLQQGRVLAQLVDPQWVIDHCLRASDVSPTPWRPTTREENGLADNDPTGPQLWVSGVGGYLPSIGWLDNYDQHQFPNTEGGGPEMYEAWGEPHPEASGPFPKNMTGLGNTGNDLHKYWGADRTRVNPIGIQVAGLTMITRGSNATYYQSAASFKVMDINVGGGVFISLWIGDSGKFWSEWTNGTVTLTSTKVTIPTTGTSQRLVAMWDTFWNGGTVRHWTRAGSNTSGANWTSGGAHPTFPGTYQAFQGLVAVRQKIAFNDLFWTATNFGNLAVATAEGWGGRNAAYPAELDAGLNRLSFLPSRKADDAWNVIQEVATAEFGAVFWDESGTFKFWNQDTLQGLKTVIAKSVSLDEVSGLRITNHLDSVRNIWSLVNSKKMAFDTLPNVEAQALDEFYVPGLTERIFTINIDNSILYLFGFLPRYSTSGMFAGAWNDNVWFGYVVQWLIGGVWQEDNSRLNGVDIQSYMNHKGEIEIKIWNGWSEPARLATNGGAPALHIYASRILEDEPSTTTFKDLGSIDKYGGRNLVLDGVWHQEFTNNTGLVSEMLTRTSVPTPITDDITMAGDPRIQLGDTIRINDIDGFGERFDVQVYGINRSWSVADGLSDTYTVELVRPGGSFWDDPIYGIWDDTFMWGV
jgi:hypothetical protein